MPTTYRYMAASTPTNIKAIVNQLPAGVGTVAITTPPPTMIDVQLENTSTSTKEDLDEFMAEIGYLYMDTDPAPLTNGETVVWENGAWTCINIAPITVTSDNEEGTTKTSSIQKMRNGFTSPSATAKYVVLYDATYETTSGGCKCEIQLVLNGSEVLAEVVDKPGGKDKPKKFSGFIEPRVYADGAHTIDINYRKTGGSGSVNVRSAKVTVWRVP